MPLPLLKKVLPAQTRLSLRKFFWLSRSWLYLGTNVYCPLCERSFRTFLPFGKERRSQALCPRCHTLERHRLLWLYLQEQVHLQERSLAVLHMAPEPIVQQRLHALPNLLYRSADLTSPVAMDRVDLQALPYATASFDLILCSHVLAHVPDETKALQELRRVLKPQGQLLLQARLHPQEKTLETPEAVTPLQRQQVYGQSDRFRKYGQDFGERVAAQGFTVQAVAYANSRPAEEQTRLGLGLQELIFVATHPAHEVA
ncbi:class I SAM-dependent methyltransferase [Rufibacter glacialis]|nr:class I SAM-dependent methyltransferase [Rufibacter glacialis]